MSPDYKDKLATQIESNFLTLEDRVMKDIVRQIYKEGKITSTADHQINRLLTLGNSTEDIENMLKDALNASYPEMFELYDQVINWEYVRNKDIYEQINGNFIPYEENDYLKQLTEGLIRQTKGELENFTGSMGFYLNYNGKRILTPLAEVYQGYLNNAIMDIATGSFDYNTVLRRVVTELTNSGLRKIDYASGRAYRANVAARMSVMTGISQLTAHISDYNAEKLGTQYFEVAWHAGARPTHQAWQGKVYTKEELRTVCGLGTATGLLGVNCYHEYYPFFPGISERNWTDEWLKQHNEAENTPRNWKGKDYTLYEAKQRQREMERVMRAQREKVDLLKHGHADPDEIMLERCKYQAQLDEYSRFSKRMKLEQERARIYLDGYGRIAPYKLKYINLDDFESDFGGKLYEIFMGTSKQKKFFKESLNNVSNQDVKKLLEQSLERVTIKRSSTKRSRYSRKEKTVYLAKSASPDTLAHELFHEIDDVYGLTLNGMLKESIKNDYKLLQNLSIGYGISVEKMLYYKYPQMFNDKKERLSLKSEYRGFSDILNGMSLGNIDLGFKHDKEYWEKPNRVEAEVFAQFGREIYIGSQENSLLEEWFPNCYKEIFDFIKRMIE